MSITVVDSLFNALERISTPPDGGFTGSVKEAELTPEAEANLNHIRDAFKGTTVESI